VAETGYSPRSWLIVEMDHTRPVGVPTAEARSCLSAPARARRGVRGRRRRRRQRSAARQSSDRHSCRSRSGGGRAGAAAAGPGGRSGRGEPCGRRVARAARPRRGRRGGAGEAARRAPPDRRPHVRRISHGAVPARSGGRGGTAGRARRARGQSWTGGRAEPGPAPSRRARGDMRGSSGCRSAGGRAGRAAARRAGHRLRRAAPTGRRALRHPRRWHGCGRPLGRQPGDGPADAL
jgi:hypothetical protein